MRWEMIRDEAKALRRFSLEIHDRDLQQAVYGPREQEMIAGLVQQQEDDPTAEGALMILQMRARAIERGQRRV